MFNKKGDPDEQRRDPGAPVEEAPRVVPSAKASERATIGPSIRIRGDLTGEEDLVVQGEVEGTIGLRNNLVTIGTDGKVAATVNAQVIVVEGKVEGDLIGDEQVVVRRSGDVRGNITAPRVTLEDGCRFKGSIDMDVEPGAQSRGAGYGGKLADIKPAAGLGDGAKSGDR